MPIAVSDGGLFRRTRARTQDLANVVALNSLAEAFHPQLKIKTLATAVVDFTGRRMIAQSLVPGILNVSAAGLA